MTRLLTCCAERIRANRSNLLRFIPPLLVEIGWWMWALLDAETRLGRFTEPTPYVGQYYYMSVTMVFGSMVAGSTSEGGGAVAFPVMTLLLGVPPLVARDFSFGIQAFGMTVASITIFGLNVPVDHEALVWATIGGCFGLAVGLAGIAPYLPPAYAKLLFVSVWMTFAVALFKLNSVAGRDRRVYRSALESDESLLRLRRGAHREEENKTTTAPQRDNNNDASDDEDPVVVVVVETAPRSAAADNNDDKQNELMKRKRLAILLFMGFFGGICSSVAGSGLDIASFSVLTLYYRVSEKVATPTSVVLMAVNAIAGVVFRTAIGLGGPYADGQEEAVWNFVSVCVPIVVIGAPLGATISAGLPRHWLAYLIYVLDCVQFVSALVIIRPWAKEAPQNLWLCVTSGVALVVGTAFFFKVASCGESRGGKCLQQHADVVKDDTTECNNNRTQSLEENSQEEQPQQ